MLTSSMPLAVFFVTPEGVWLQVESPESGRRAAINIAEVVGDSSEVAEAFKEWSDFHVSRLARSEG
jgi:hypothetical protein